VRQPSYRLVHARLHVHSTVLPCHPLPYIIVANAHMPAPVGCRLIFVRVYACASQALHISHPRRQRSFVSFVLLSLVLPLCAHAQAWLLCVCCRCFCLWSLCPCRLISLPLCRSRSGPVTDRARCTFELATFGNLFPYLAVDLMLFN
jgi:hypothetical protein